jgi:hypothetical protein
MSSEDYLSHIDQKLNLPVGTIYSLCKAAVKSKIIERDECRVTYKGVSSRSIKLNTGQFVSAPRKVFLIEGSKTDRGRKVLAQVFLSIPDV